MQDTEQVLSTPVSSIQYLVSSMSENTLQYFPLTKRQILIIANIFFWTCLIVFDSTSVAGVLGGYYDYTFTRAVIHCIVFAFLVYPNL